MKKTLRRSINKVFHITKNKSLYVLLINIYNKSFNSFKNKVEYDNTNNFYWLKYGNQYLQAVDSPHFDFNKEALINKFQDIFLQFYKIERNDVIIDLGAGIGAELFFLQSKIGKSGKIYAIEASPNSFNKLNTLIKKNPYHNCGAFNYAISSYSGDIWMEEEENYRIAQTNKVKKGVKVPCYTLDQFVINNRITKINFLKVNIEGGEYDMIDGMKDSINIIENLAISCHDFLDDKPGKIIQNKVESFLKAHNFNLEYRHTGDKVLDSWIYGSKIEN